MNLPNVRMKAYLLAHGIDATPKYLPNGSLKGCWRLTGKDKKSTGLFGYQIWTTKLQNKLTELGFVDFDGKPLHQFSGNGGVFSVFVRGHKEFLI